MSRVLIFAVLLVPRVAWPDAQMIRLTDLLSRATVVGVVRLAAQRPDGSAIFRVKRAITGTRAGQKLSYPHVLYAPDGLRKQDLLLICHPSVCPILGLRRGAFFIFPTYYGMRAPLLVNPSALERRSVARVAAGQEAHPICLRLHLNFLEDEQQKETITFRGPLREREGRAESILFGRALWPASATIGVREEAGPAEVYLTAVFKGGGQQIPLQFVGGGSLTSRGRCYDLSGYGYDPLVRTRADLKKLLQGRVAPQVLAKGVIRIRAGAAIEHGTYEVSVRTTDTGGYPLLLRTSVGGKPFDRTVQRKDQNRQRCRVGFALHRSSVSPSYPRLYFDVGDVRAFPFYVGEHMDFAYEMARAKRISSTIYFQKSRDGQAKPVGSIELEAVSGR